MVTAALHRRRRRASVIAGEAFVATGKLIGYVRPRLRLLPGLAGAVAVSWGVGQIASHLWGHGLAPWVGALVGGIFCLRLDGRITISITPRSRGG